MYLSFFQYPRTKDPAAGGASVSTLPPHPCLSSSNRRPLVRYQSLSPQSLETNLFLFVFKFAFLKHQTSTLHPDCFMQAAAAAAAL
jgi:hypothetical protein